MASQLLNTDISGLLKLNKIKLPNGTLDADGSWTDWSSGGDGSTITHGYISNPADGSLEARDGIVQWGGVFMDNISDDLATYYTPPTQGQYSPSSTVSTSETNGSKFSGTFTIDSNGDAFLFGGRTTNSAGIPVNGSTQYVSITIPAGHEASVDFTIKAADYIKRGGVDVHSCSMSSYVASISAMLSTTATLVLPTSTNVLKKGTLRVPIKTSNSMTDGEVGVTLSYKNTTSESKTIFARIVGVGGTPIQNIRMTSGGAICTSGSIVVSFLTSIVVNIIKSEVNIPGAPEAFPAGKPLTLIGQNGNVFIDDAGNMTLDLPSVYYVRRGRYYLKIDSSGIKTSSNGTTWTSK